MKIYKLIVFWLIKSVLYQNACGELCIDGSSKENVTFTRNFTGIYFKPFVTDNWLLLDDLTEYDVSFLLKKINSKFDRIMVNINGNYGTADESDLNLRFKEMTPIAVAKLNKYNLSESPMLLTISVSVSSSKKYNNFSANTLSKIIAKVQSMHSKSIEYILLDIEDITDDYIYQVEEFLNFVDSINVNGYFKIAFGIDIEYCKQYYFDLSISPKTTFVTAFDKLLRENRDMTYFLIDIEVKSEIKVQIFELIEYFKICTRLVKAVLPNSDTGLEARMIVSENYGNTDYKNFVDSYKIMNEVAEKMQIKVILHHAFDLSYMSSDVVLSTAGWWTVYTNVKYKGVAELRIEDKTCSYNKEVNEDFRDNVTWLNLDTEFHRRFVGVSVNLRILEVGRGLENIIQLISTKFSLLAIFSANSMSKGQFESIAKTISKTEVSQHQMKIVVVFLSAFVNDIVMLADAGNRIQNGTYEFLVYYIKPDEYVDIIYQTFDEIMVVKNISLKYKWGVMVWMEFCNNEGLETISLLSPDVIIFRVETKPLYAKVGVERNVLAHFSMFETCKGRVFSALGNIELFFMVEWQAEVEDDFLYLIKYWEEMNEWANKTGTNLIFDSAIDVDNSNSKTYSGWWTQTNSKPFKAESKKEFLARMAHGKLPNRLKKWNGIESELQMGLAAVFVLFVVTLLVTFYVIGKRKSNYLTQIDLQEFFCPDDAPNGHGEYRYRFYEFRRNDFKPTCIISKTPFGHVFQGSIKVDGQELQVAAKISKKACPTIELQKLMHEIKTLAILEKHDNIVELVGACLAELRKSVATIYLEFCELGSLKKYLRWISIEIDENNKHKFDCGKISNEVEKDMARWALEIANGMEYITNKKVIHMDLATRNILLTSTKIAKISNFKLSRRLDKYEMYVKMTYEELPWRWMAPEALKRFEFSEKTDVWAFGVTLWEIYSLGDLPYCGLEWNRKFENFLLNGLRLGIPKYSKGDTCSIMTSCWAKSPEERPSFSQLKCVLQAQFVKLQEDDGDSFECEFDVVE